MSRSVTICIYLHRVPSHRCLRQRSHCFYELDAWLLWKSGSPVSSFTLYRRYVSFQLCNCCGVLVLMKEVRYHNGHWIPSGDFKGTYVWNGYDFVYHYWQRNIVTRSQRAQVQEFVYGAPPYNCLLIMLMTWSFNVMWRHYLILGGVSLRGTSSFNFREEEKNMKRSKFEVFFELVFTYKLR